MKKWEDILKDRLEGYESTLPESSLAEFRALRTAGGTAARKKAYPLIWTVAAGLAAGLAAVLLLRRPVAPEEGIQVVHEPPVVQNQVEDTSIVVHPMVTPHFLGQSTVTKIVPEEANPDTSEKLATTEDRTEVPESTEIPETASSPKPSTNPSAGNASTTMTSPYIPLTGRTQRVNISVAPAAGEILGGGILAALATYLTDGKNNTIPSYIGHGAVVNSPSGSKPADNHQGSGFGSSSTPGDNPGYYPSDPQPGDPISQEEPVKDLLEQSTHCFPIKAGLSSRLPLTDKLFLTAGLEYSFYRSKYNMSYSGEKWQRVHYLGIPVRLDWVFASHSLFDVYLGGGMRGDFCLNASLAGKDIKKDRPGLSLVGVGGVQMNATKRLGLYVEPELSWMIPNENNTLVTYRSEHPLMFSVSAGIRINLGNQ